MDHRQLGPPIRQEMRRRFGDLAAEMIAPVQRVLGEQMDQQAALGRPAGAIMLAGALVAYDLYVSCLEAWADEGAEAEAWLRHQLEGLGAPGRS